MRSEGLEHDAFAVAAQHRSRRGAQALINERLSNYRAGTSVYLRVLTANAEYQQSTLSICGPVANDCRTPLRCSWR